VLSPAIGDITPEQIDAAGSKLREMSTQIRDDYDRERDAEDARSFSAEGK
jgi:hypothetical protein